MKDYSANSRLVKYFYGRTGRRGIVLLMVVSMLAIFMLVGITFVVVSSRYRQAVTSTMRRSQTGRESPFGLADEVAMQVLRGSKRQSSLAGHDLLTDMWGNDGVRGIVANVTVQGSGQFLEITYLPDPHQPHAGSNRNPPYYGGRFARSDHAYAGSLATIEPLMWHPGPDGAWGVRNFDDNGDGVTDNLADAGGPGSDDSLVTAWQPGLDGAWGVAGFDDDGNGTVDDIFEAGWVGSDDIAPPRSSSRIVASGSNANGFWIRVETFPEFRDRGNAPAIANRVLINGVAFNGTGMGFNPARQKLDAVLLGLDNAPGLPGVDDDSSGTSDDPSELGKIGILPGPSGPQPSDDVHIAMLPHFRANAFGSPILGAGNILPAYPTTFMDAGYDGNLATLADNNLYTAGFGGEDEDYDAPDLQNMMLAFAPANVTSSLEIIPSLHRPQLLKFLRATAFQALFNNYSLTPAQADAFYEAPMIAPGPLTPVERQYLLNLKRMHVLRPLSDDHPNFPLRTMFQLSNGIWDVDTDGDGIVDSIWVDAGLPVSPGPDGTLRKPLVAIYCRDLDGRLDLNAHSSFAHLPRDYDNAVRYNANQYAILNRGADGEWGVAGVDDDGNGTTDDFSEAYWPGSDDRYFLDTLTLTDAAGGTTAQSLVGRGAGMGPAEVNFAWLFRPQTEFANLLTGRYQSDPALPAWRTGSAHQVGSRNGTVDPESILKHHGWPIDSTTLLNVANSDYGSLIDVRGEGSYYLDYAGLPITLNKLNRPQLIDSPYGANALLRGILKRPLPGPDGAWGQLMIDDDNNGVMDDFSEAGWPGTDDIDADSLFGLNELERLLRHTDQDAAKIHSRIMQLAPSTFATSGDAKRNRNLFTTMSSQVPAPAYFPTTDFRTDPGGLGAYFTNPGPDGQFGVAGVDDDGNGTVDDFAEAGWPGSDDYPEPPTLAALYRAKLLRANPGRTDISLQLALMLPTEVIHGMKFNLNRAFGNGRDDDNDGIIDQPMELFRNFRDDDGDGLIDEPDELERAWTSSALGSFFTLRRFWHGNGDLLSMEDRQIYARHLYCLMMALIDHPRVAGMSELGFRFDGAATSQSRELTARRIAQWCVNVVDFRDSDGIMTPFEYDVDPFDANGWSVDGWHSPETVNNRTDIGPGPDGRWGVAYVDDDGMNGVDDPGEAGWMGSDDTFDTVLADRRVVWGCESPDLLLTEAVAFHDRRVKDTSNDASGERRPMDNHLDQYRIPQGSLFLELYCPSPRYANNPRTRLELFTTQANAHKLDLARMASPNSPVWRVAISRAHHDGTGLAAMRPVSRRVTHVNSVTFQPENMDVLNPADDLPIERYITFARVTPASLDTRAFPNAVNTVYYNRFPTSLLDAGGYAVVGPRMTTHMGVEDDTGMNYTPSRQRIVLDASGSQTYNATHFRHNGMGGTTSDPTGNVKQPLLVIAAALPPPGWGSLANTANIGVPGEFGIGINVSEPLRNSYYTEPSYSYHASLPRDSYFDPATNTGVLPNPPFDSRNGYPLKDENLLKTGTTFHYKTAFVQRLANPTIAFDPRTNPYVTVDWMSIDLSVFNGQDREPSGWDSAMHGQWDPDDPDPAGADLKFETRERNGASFNNWAQVTADPNDTNPVGGLSDYFRHNLRATLGYLNSSYGRTAAPPAYVGDPTTPFPWITWLDRPFSNRMELLLVPAAGPGRLLHEYSIPPVFPGNPYANQPYGHLLNFLQDLNPPMPPAPIPNNPSFHRLLDFVDVPSPFVGTEKWYDAEEFEQGAGAEYFGFRPPFNRMSLMRDPGLINANTITDPEVWQSYAIGTPAITGIWNSFAASRAGTGLYPTQFAFPFRSATSDDLSIDCDDMRQRSIKSGLLRQANTGSTTPLFNSGGGNTWAEATRNPYFRYQGFQRVGSGLARHSNVYAVWITVGYFEVEPNPAGVDLGHPDGYRYGREHGSETGNVSRHRAFYILDRSSPVGFLPGDDLNANEAILLKRHIE